MLKVDFARMDPQDILFGTRTLSLLPVIHFPASRTVPENRIVEPVVRVTESNLLALTPLLNHTPPGPSLSRVVRMARGRDWYPCSTP